MPTNPKKKRTAKNPVHEVIKADDGRELNLRDAHYDLSILLHDDDRIGAVCRDPHNCVIALAVERVLKQRHKTDDVRASIGAAFAHVRVRDDIYRWVIPQNERAMIAWFDGSDGGFAPGSTINLKAPNGTNRLGARPGRPRGRNNGTRPRTGNGARSVARRQPSRHVSAPLSSLTDPPKKSKGGRRRKAA